MAGLFITFEGGEGTGKSTQVKRLAEYLRSQGRDVVVTREPGGTPQGEALRNVLVTGETRAWSAEAEALLNYAARDSHLKCVIRPSLQKGQTVLCDRFMDSTRVYQGIAGGCSQRLIDMLESEIVGSTKPDLTFIFDLDPVVGLTRAKQRGGADRYERKGLPYHQKIRDGFRAIARAEPRRCVLIDASTSEDQVFEQVLQGLNRHG